MPKINKAIIEKAKKISNKGSSTKKVVEPTKDSVFIPKKYRAGNLDIDNLYPMDGENLIKPSFFNAETEAKQYRNNTEITTEDPHPTESQNNKKQEKIPKQKRNNTETKIKDPYPTESQKNETIPKQKRSNTETKAEQYRSRSETMPKQKQNNTETEAKPNEEQYRNRSGTEAEPNAKQLPKQKRNNTETKTEQYRNISETIPKQPSFITDTPSITLLSGKPKKIVFYLFESCSLNGGLETSEIMYPNMAIDLELKSRDVARVLTNRLVKQKYFHKIETKKGKSSWIRFKFDIDIYQKLHSIKTANFSNLLSNQSEKNIINTETEAKQYRNNTEAKCETKRETTPPSSSSNLNNNINRTTTREDEEGGGQSNLFGLPPEWEQINFFGLNEKIRFGIQQLKNIYNKNHLTASQCESALEAFANDLEKNIIKSTKSPLSFLMGIMLKGEYNSIDPTFKTEEETVFEQQMQAKIAKANRMRELKQHAQEASCDLWIDGLAKEDKDQIFSKLEVFGLERMKDREKEVHLKQYHSDEIWPTELAKMKKG